MSVSSKLLILAVVLGVVLSLTGIDLLLQVEGNAFLGIPYPPEFLDRYWTDLPAVGRTLTGAGSVMILASAVLLVIHLRKDTNARNMRYDLRGNLVKRTEIKAKMKFDERTYDTSGNIYTSTEREYNIGADGSMQSGDEPRATLKCINCGTEVDIAVTICPSCGMKLASTL